ncbi:MAG: hypothetical protein CVU90_03270 [Firmicutes bacterium HGW-Firmicutes-15]|nr:MAG: hypothetical protein CVU90_03270 [Firmicutes bacterium HGW-Firmicutes-15]
MNMYITLFIVLLLAGLATLIKYLGGEGMISGYNTASPTEQKYMSEKGIGAFMGNYLYFLAGIILAGYLSKKAGFVWGEDISWALFVVIIIIMLIRAQRFNPPASMTTPQSVRTQKIGLWAGAIITVAVAGVVTWNALPTQFNLQANQLEITGAYGININYSDIDDIRLQTELPAVGVKTNGLNMGPILKGHFIVEEMGSARLFLRSAHGPVLIITFKNNSNPVLINFSDPAETTQLFQQLKSQTR